MRVQPQGGGDPFAAGQGRLRAQGGQRGRQALQLDKRQAHRLARALGVFEDGGGRLIEIVAIEKALGIAGHPA